MTIKNKRSPVGVPQEMDRTVQTIYNDINEVINSINKVDSGLDTYVGDIGNIRAIQEANIDGTIQYYIEFKTEDGWSRVKGSLRTNSNITSTEKKVTNGTYKAENWNDYEVVNCDTTSGNVLIYGIISSTKSKVLHILKSNSSNNIIIYNNSASNAIAGNKILLPGCTATDDSDYLTIGSGYGGATLVYSSDKYWVCIGHTGTITA